MSRHGPESVIIANEYLDALPFRLVKRAPATGWFELRVGSTIGDDGFEFLEMPADPKLIEYCARWGGGDPR